MKQYSQKCNNDSCNNIVYECNKKTKELKKYCSDKCRYASHSKKMIKHPLSADAPVCKYHLCNNVVSKKTSGGWKKYCCLTCQNKQVAYERSDFSKGAPPKCHNTECSKSVIPGRNGHWRKFCSRKCAGRFNSRSTRETAALTCYKRYGYANFQIAHLGADLCSKLDSAEFLSELYSAGKLREFIVDNSLNSKLVTNRLRKYGIIDTSVGVNTFENDVIGFLRNNNIEFELRNRSIVKPQELDIVIHSHKLAIECNGSYWHSELNGKDKQYHLRKTTSVKNYGYELFHIWEHEWILKKDIIRSMLQSRLGQTTVVYGRSTVVREVSYTEERAFLNNNHIQGYVASKYCYGLYHNDRLVSLMSFSKSRYDHGKIELLRFCNLAGTTVVGGASKLFKYFTECVQSANTIISYSHRDKFTGALYLSLGFSYSHSTLPAYYYTKDYVSFENRLKFQKHKLPNLLNTFDQNRTEWENMQDNGYDRIWDCGNDVWIWNR